jgi:hypothetical protein
MNNSPDTEAERLIQLSEEVPNRELATWGES